MVKSPYRSRERILLFAREGCGKTTAALHVARFIHPQPMWVVSNDNSVDRLLETEFTDLGCVEIWDGDERDPDHEDSEGNIYLFNVRDWPAFEHAIERVWEVAGRDDWIFVDNMTWPWEEVRKWYTQEVYGKDMNDMLVEYRKTLDTSKGHQSGEALFNEWSFINPKYYGLLAERIIMPPCHLIYTALAKPLRSDGKVDRELADMYGSLGMQPDGQKKLGPWSQSVLFLTRDKKGYYLNNKVKDRGRDTVEKMPWDDFAADYLVGLAGWPDEGDEGDEGGDEDEPAPAPAPVKKVKKKKV